MSRPTPDSARLSRAALLYLTLASALTLNAVACSGGGERQDPSIDVDAGVDAGGMGAPDAGEIDAGASNPGGGPDAGAPDASGGEESAPPALELIAGPTQMMAMARASLFVRLDRAARATTRVEVSAGEGISLTAETIEIEAEATSAEMAIEAGGEAAPGVLITATLDGAALTHAIDVLARADAPTSLSLGVAPNPVEKGASVCLTVLLDAPASEAVEVALSADCGSLDAAIVIPPGVNAAVTDFDARGCPGERATITATADGLTGGEATIDLKARGSGLVLNQIMTRGRSADAEFIELFNGGDEAIDLSPYVLWYGGAGETRPSINLNAVKNFSLNGRTIAARGHFLIAFEGALDAFEGVAADVAVDAAGGFNDEVGGSIWLTDSDEPPSLESGEAVDLVGWGGAASFEGHAAALSPSEENSAIKRQPDGQDTGDNAEDFALLERATPRGSTDG